MMQKQILGIFVPSNKHIDHLIGIARAAKKAGNALCIFFTHDGVLMTQDPKYQELAAIVGDNSINKISLCNASWEELGLKDRPVPQGMGPDDLATQSRHCTLIGTCDRYLVI